VLFEVLQLIAKSKRLSLILLTCFAFWYSASALAEPPENSVLIDKFDLIWSNQSGNLDCAQLLRYLKQPTVYDPNNIAKSLLASSRTFIWQYRNAKGELLPPKTLGDICSQRRPEGMPEELLVDLDGDGAPEELSRVWNESKSLSHNQLFVLDASSQTTGKQKYKELLDAGKIQMLARTAGNESFDRRNSRLFELLEVDERPYVIALDTLGIGDDLMTDRIALVFEFKPKLTPTLACVLKTKVFSVN